MKNWIKKINELFKNKEKRKLYIFLFCLPFIIGMIVFGTIAIVEAKDLIKALSSGSKTPINSKYQINNGDYIIRDNATDLQMELFSELKDMLENNTNYNEKRYAELVAESYVCDFYTWTNKKSQYDVGGMYYIFSEIKSNQYINARDEFYKYLSNYIEKYGSKNLLEVETISAITTKSSAPYIYTDADGVEHSYSAYTVKCNWTYKASSSFSPNQYENNKTFTVVNNNGRFEIVEAA